MTSSPRYFYFLIALMLLIAREDIDGIRVRDRIEILLEKDWIV